MKKLMYTGAVMVASLAMSAVVTSPALAFSEFEATGELPTALGGQAVSAEQIFTAEAGGPKIECSEATPSGNVTEPNTSHQKVTVSYKKCKAAGGLAKTNEPIVEEYEFNIDGTVTILKSVVITITPIIGASCTVEVLPQTRHEAVTYENNGKNLNVIAETKEIESNISGGDCGKAGLSKTGTYEGEVESSLANGGTLSVK